MLKQDVKIQRKNGIKYEAAMPWILGQQSKIYSNPASQLANISPMKTPRKSRIHKKDLNEVAAAWKAAQMQPSFESTGKFVAKKLSISHSLARTRIRQCRQAGLIPASTHGNAVVKPRITKRNQVKKRRKK
jgi:hypothetical protein